MIEEVAQRGPRQGRGKRRRTSSRISTGTVDKEGRWAVSGMTSSDVSLDSCFTTVVRAVSSCGSGSESGSSLLSCFTFFDGGESSGSKSEKASAWFREITAWKRYSTHLPTILVVVQGA